jgi:DNA-binding NarL/FixJ family response regulator
MPEMDGPAAKAYLIANYPDIKIVALSMNYKKETIFKMIRNRACSYLFKDTNPDILKTAVNEIMERGYFNADAYHQGYPKLMQYEKQAETQKLTQEKCIFWNLPVTN